MSKHYHLFLNRRKTKNFEESVARAIANQFLGFGFACGALLLVQTTLIDRSGKFVIPTMAVFVVQGVFLGSERGCKSSFKNMEAKRLEPEGDTPEELDLKDPSTRLILRDGSAMLLRRETFVLGMAAPSAIVSVMASFHMTGLWTAITAFSVAAGALGILLMIRQFKGRKPVSQPETTS
jgi:hypothetical protein